MPLELVEILKLLGGIIVIIIPGYFWGFFLIKDTSFSERIVLGFSLGILFFLSFIILINHVVSVEISNMMIFLLYLLYCIPACFFYGHKILRWGIPKVDTSFIHERKFQILIGILFFNFVLTFLPHIINDYYLPFHVDEWINWASVRSVIETGSTSFVSPFTGGEVFQLRQIGFSIVTSLIYFISGSDLLTIFLFMPSILMVFITLAIFNIGERSFRKHGLESAFLIGFMPTTIQLLGPSFYVAVMLGIFLVVFMIWLFKINSRLTYILIIGLLLCIFIVHPPSAFAAVVFLFSFLIVELIKHDYNRVFSTSLFIIVSIFIFMIAYFLNGIWSIDIDKLFLALGGTRFPSVLQDIWMLVYLLGILVWGLFIIGVYYSITQDDILKKSITLSSIFFILIIGIYINVGYGFPVLIERGWLFLYLFVTMIGGIGFHELVHDNKIIDNIKLPENLISTKKTLLLIILILLIATVLPIQISVPYYQMITEQEYSTFLWIKNNIHEYENEYIQFTIGAVDPNIASAFSAITGLYTISSNMHPIYGMGFWGGQYFIR
jgi:hypothetical protein